MPDAAFWQTPASGPLLRAIASALDGLAQGSAVNASIAVALSGGADSAMLAAHAARVARQRGLALHCLHVHHGLQASADDWQEHAHTLARLLGLSCHTCYVRIEAAASRSDGIESAARDARYAALAGLAHALGIQHVLLAHHLDDQAETVLLRLLRGAGPTGLAAMAPLTVRDGITYARPWLDIRRDLILAQAGAFARHTGWKPVQDPTNVDEHYTRAAVRERLAPALNDRWPGWQGALARHARQSAELRDILDEVAAQDFATLAPSADGTDFSLAAWRLLSAPRQALVLRHWLAGLGLRMPTDARLRDLMRQLRQLHALGHDRQMQVKHGDYLIVCKRGRVGVERAVY
ncbi:tRNA lysidine(34) synthetase TilS [Pusillimonas sp. TS35]|nr:tRNA lysidine(34) synthetase TilS [Pusillimonas sp. TS35]